MKVSWACFEELNLLTKKNLMVRKYVVVAFHIEIFRRMACHLSTKTWMTRLKTKLHLVWNGWETEEATGSPVQTTFHSRFPRTCRREGVTSSGEKRSICREKAPSGGSAQEIAEKGRIGRTPKSHGGRSP
jgi:hypothetical protein